MPTVPGQDKCPQPCHPGQGLQALACIYPSNSNAITTMGSAQTKGHTPTNLEERGLGKVDRIWFWVSQEVVDVWLATGRAAHRVALLLATSAQLPRPQESLPPPGSLASGTSCDKED